MLKFLVLLFIILTFGNQNLSSYFLIPAPVFAQTLPYGWQIDNFQSDIDIQSDGTVKVAETIKVDFDSLEKHGIYRDIPYIYTDSSGNKTYTQIAVESVSRNGASENYQTIESNGYLRIKIGDANKTISGIQTYKIDYVASGVTQGFSTFDELYWNTTGNYWDVPIQNATATITLPKDSILQSACYQGVSGSSTECDAQNDGPSATFNSITPMGPGEGMTIAAGYKKGLVPILTIARPKTLWEKITSPANLFLTLLTFSALWALIFSRWWKNGRDFWFRRKDLFDPLAKEEKKPIGAHETIVVEYAPPKNLRPAELGTLIDQKADNRDVTATIIDLATRGFLKIEEVPKSWVFGKVDYNLIKKSKNNSTLLPYEKELYDAFFNGRESVKTSSLKYTFYQDLAKVKNLLYDNLVSKKLFFKRPDKVRSVYLVVAIFAIAGSVGATIIGLASQAAPIVSIALGLLVGCLPLLVLANFMPRRTAHGHDLYLKTQGYFLFVDKAEKHRQRFFENKNLFNEVLPYAITFGLTEKFAQAMKDIGLKPQTTSWYAGTHAFNVGTFGNNIESFSNSVSRSMASTPHSSGSSGGGSSGGGFGGGGGGSW